MERRTFVDVANEEDYGRLLDAVRDDDQDYSTTSNTPMKQQVYCAHLNRERAEAVLEAMEQGIDIAQYEAPSITGAPPSDHILNLRCVQINILDDYEYDDTGIELDASSRGRIEAPRMGMAVSVILMIATSTRTGGIIIRILRREG
jgi:hypothetical protein